MQKLHDNRLSMVKALGIIYIVAGHAAIYTSLSRFLYLFHVAVFFFVAGYFFKDDSITNPSRFILNKLKRLYVPWLVYGISFILLHNLFLKYKLILYNISTKTYFEPYSLQTVFEKILNILTFYRGKEPLLAPLWFLFGLFSGLMVFYAVSYITKKSGNKNQEIFRFVLMLSISIVGFIGTIFYPRLGLFFRALVIAGIIYTGKLYQIFENKINITPVVAFLSLMILIVATKLNYDVNIGGMKYGNPLSFYIVSIAGFHITLSIAGYLSKKQNYFVRLLDIIGNNTLAIMALHYLAFKLVSLLQIAIYHYPIKYLAYYPVIPYKTAYWWIPYTIVGIIVPLIMAIFYDKIIELIKLNFSKFRKVN